MTGVFAEDVLDQLADGDGRPNRERLELVLDDLERSTYQDGLFLTGGSLITMGMLIVPLVLAPFSLTRLGAGSVDFDRRAIRWARILAIASMVLPLLVTAAAITYATMQRSN